MFLDFLCHLSYGFSGATCRWVAVPLARGQIFVGSLGITNPKGDLLVDCCLHKFHLDTSAFGSGWWFGTMEWIMTFSSHEECHHPSWQSPSFVQRGRLKPPTSYSWMGFVRNKTETITLLERYVVCNNVLSSYLPVKLWDFLMIYHDIPHVQSHLGGSSKVFHITKVTTNLGGLINQNRTGLRMWGSPIFFSVYNSCSYSYKMF